MPSTSNTLEIFILGFGYFLGSIPNGYLAGLWIAKIDLRQKGSGSTGATNVLRHVGKWPALIVFLLDVIKGTIPVLIFKFNRVPTRVAIPFHAINPEWEVDNQKMAIMSMDDWLEILLKNWLE